MIYVVKCYACEHEFRVKRGETGADMMCPECGTANNIRDVIERIEEQKKVDTDLETIKGFDMSMNPVVDDYWERYAKRKWIKFLAELIGGVIAVIILLVMRLLNKI